MKNDRANILIIENSKSFTGAFSSILNYANRLKEYFNFVWVIPTNSEVRPSLEEYSFVIYEVPFHEISKNLKSMLYPLILIRNTLLINRIIEIHGIKIVHVNDLYNMCGVLLKIFTSTKVVYHIRLLPTSYIGNFFFLYKSLVSLVADRICVVSNAVRKYFKRSSKVILLSDWIQIPQTGEKKNSQLFIILYVGAVMKGKGQMEALKVARLLKGETEHFQMKFVGSYDEKDSFYKSLEEYVHSNDLQNHIVFEGFKNDLTKTYSNANVLLNLSFSESFSMVSLEASMHSLPVISYDSGGPSDIIDDGNSGHLVDIGDIHKVRDLLSKYESNPKLLQELGVKARTRVKKKFSGDMQCQTLCDLYHMLIDQQVH